MPNAPTANLPNPSGHITRHTCMRLEIRGEGKDKSIYPIYRCSETAAERVFGYLPSSTPKRHLRKLYPGVELVAAHSAVADNGGKVA